MNVGDKFLMENSKFWNHRPRKKSDRFVLVETHNHPVINHANAIVGKMTANVHQSNIAWLNAKDKDLMKSYSKTSVFWQDSKVNLMDKVRLLLLALWYYLNLSTDKKQILRFTYNGILYGDLAYDSYLARYKLATLNTKDKRLVWVFYSLLKSDLVARDLIKKKPKAIVISHHIGSTGPLTRVALQHMIPVYWKGGGDGVLALSVFRSLDEIYNFPLKPSSEELDELMIKLGKAKVDGDLRTLTNEIMSGSRRDSATKAYHAQKKKISNKVLLKKYGLKGAENIFVMLHAFNDHPHSQFGEMLFDDYYDWFNKTLEFAIRDYKKNWFFKEHPYNHLYTTFDLDLREKLKGMPRHIKFISADEEFSTQTVLNVADLVITCLGSIGLELPALAGRKAIIAGKSAYDGLGFTIEPKTKAEYFKCLENIPDTKLSKRDQLRAKVAFLYVKKYTSAAFSAGPKLSVEEVAELSGNISKEIELYGEIMRKYKNDKKAILAEFEEYTRQIAKPDFKKLLVFD